MSAPVLLMDGFSDGVPLRRLTADLRDNNVRSKILSTDQFPEATFTLTKPADVSQVPDDGTVTQVELTGDLTIRGQTREVSQPFNVARSGENRMNKGEEAAQALLGQVALRRRWKLA